MNIKANNFIDSVYQLYEKISPLVYNTPLVQSSLGRGNIFLKCENLQQTNSFKYRGALSAILSYKLYEPKNWEHILQDGIVTYSTGNFAKALAKISKQYNLKLTVIVHEWIDERKLTDVIVNNSKTKIIHTSLEEWQKIVIAGAYPETPGFFISSFNQYVNLGNATIGLEILQQFPEIEAIIIPYGSGSLTYSIASFLKHFKPNLDIYTAESSSGAPFFTSFKIGKNSSVAYRKTFVDGIGSSFVIPEHFKRIKPYIKDAITVTPDQIANTVVQLAMEDKLVVEGAGAASVAAALHYGINQSCCCILTGGGIQQSVLLNLFENFYYERAEHE